MLFSSQVFILGFLPLVLGGYYALAAHRAWRQDLKPWPLKGRPQPYPTREEIHDRPVLRRR